MIVTSRPRAHRFPCRARRIAVAIALLVGAGCGGGDPASTSSSAPTTTPPTTNPTNDARCAWATRADRATANIAYPDTAATYWALAFDLAPGERLELHGRFPDARYASFVAYDLGGAAVGVRTDRDLTPDRGGHNPFVDGRGVGDPFTVVLSADGSVGPNPLRGAGDDPAPGTTTPTTSAAAGRRALGSGIRTGPSVAAGSLVYRVYLARPTDDPTGGAGLPSVRVVTDVPTCAAPGENPDARARVVANGPDTAREPPPVPVFVGAAEQGLYANPDNAYLATLVAAAPGRIVVVRGHAPRTPDPEHGRRIGTDEQVRYWSVCTNEWRRPYPVTACLADDAIPVDDAGRYTIVIATAADRPTTLADHPGVVALDWGATDVPLLVLVRQMLPAADYAAAATRVEPGAPAVATMGADAPVAVLCTRAAFDAGGPDACR